MSTNEEVMRVMLVQDMNRSIIRLCKSPHTSAELVHLLTPDRSSDPTYYQALVSNSLRTLEISGMLTFSDGKWVSSKQALQVLDKYFGG